MTFVRLLAWLALLAAILLTVLPPNLRPETGAASWLEHLGFFLILGLTFSFGYRASRPALSVGAFVFTGALELTQLLVPGRHARISDFVVDCLATLAGIGCVSLLERFTSQRLPRPPAARPGEPGE